MTITNNKIEVTQFMMSKHGMVKGMNYGVPNNPKDISEGLEWKALFFFDESDCEKIETYFLLLRKDVKVVTPMISDYTV